MKQLQIATAIAATVLLSACASTPMFDQQTLPATVQVPAGHKVAMETVGAGDITYECKLKKDSADQFEWTFIGPDAQLTDRGGMHVGKYFGPPATWQANDGSKVTATQVTDDARQRQPNSQPQHVRRRVPEQQHPRQQHFTPYERNKPQ